MISSINEFKSAVQDDLAKWKPEATLWFRGESGDEPPLCPKISKYDANQENHLVQSFRRKAGGLANTPIRGETDKWLFLAQHYGIPTRLLDWTEGALLGLYFAINQKKPCPRVYMLNPHRLNELAMGIESDYLSFPLSWGENKEGYRNIALAWQKRQVDSAYDLPVAMPATYQDNRMIAQRSCFTVHGKQLGPLPDLLRGKGLDMSQCLFAYEIDITGADTLLRDLAILGVSAATIFPDLDNLAKDICSEVGNP